MTRPLLTAALLACSAPAFAAPDTIAPKGVPSAWTAPAIPPLEASYRIDRAATRKAAMRFETGFVILSAVDTVQTIAALHSGKFEEGNPLVGKHPSAAKLILVNGALTAAHFAFVSRLSRDHPKAALRVAEISVAVRGTVVGLNIRTLLK